MAQLRGSNSSTCIFHVMTAKIFQVPYSRIFWSGTQFGGFGLAKNTINFVGCNLVNHFLFFKNLRSVYF